jgi:hypothetical protein
MPHRELLRAVARATGDTLSTVRRFGFQVVEVTTDFAASLETPTTPVKNPPGVPNCPESTLDGRCCQAV